MTEPESMQQQREDASIGSDADRTRAVEDAMDTAVVEETDGAADTANTVDTEMVTDTEDAGHAADTADATTTVYVRRSRTPNLAFWVVLLILISFFGGALAAVLRGALSLAAIFNAAMLGAVVIGVPLTAVAAAVDAIMVRRRARTLERNRY